MHKKAVESQSQRQYEVRFTNIEKTQLRTILRLTTLEVHPRTPKTYSNGFDTGKVMRLIAVSRHEVKYAPNDRQILVVSASASNPVKMELAFAPRRCVRPSQEEGDYGCSSIHV